MTIRIDHLVVAARTLDEGAAWVESRLGVAPVPGGKHALMGTHNRLLRLGAGRFLEVIAIDPDAPDPGRTRWFSLDDPAMRTRLEQGPALVHWVAATDAIGRAVALSAHPAGEILQLERGDYRWRIAVPSDGHLAEAGAWPTLIEWQGGRHPAANLPECGCDLEMLLLPARCYARIRPGLETLGLAPEEPVGAATDGEDLAARISTPRGIVTLP